MKKILRSAFAGVSALVAAAAFTGCNDDPAGYSRLWFFVVENATDARVVVSCEFVGSTAEPISRDIAPSEDAIVGLYDIVVAQDSKAPLEDDLTDDTYIPEADTFRFFDGYLYYYGDGEQKFTLLVDGEPVADDVWLRRYWNYESDNYARVYTLKVTDDLLAELALL